MNKERLYLFDTTLRDGMQTTGVDFSLEDKRRLMRVLDELGVDYIEGGYPGANATDTAFPVQNLPFGIFRRRAGHEAPRAGTAIGTELRLVCS